MGPYNPDKIFHPDAVAVVGASETAGSIGRAVMANLIDGGFGGELFPVNPKYETLHGYRAYKRLSGAP